MRRGFTLVELVLVIALLAIEALILGPPLATAVKEYVLVSSRRQVLAEARSAMDRMVKEVLLIPLGGVTNVASPTSFQFQYPLGTLITYALDGTTLKRNGVDLASNVGLLEFKYYNAAGIETAINANVRRIQLRLTINSPSATGTLPLTTSVFLRNMGSMYTDFNNAISP